MEEIGIQEGLQYRQAIYLEARVILVQPQHHLMRELRYAVRGERLAGRDAAGVLCLATEFDLSLVV
jgi:hypothetical protein